jgi:hypothetical protein
MAEVIFIGISSGPCLCSDGAEPGELALGWPSLPWFAAAGGAIATVIVPAARRSQPFISGRDGAAAIWVAE